jgi:hypothetical protein
VASRQHRGYLPLQASASRGRWWIFVLERKEKKEKKKKTKTKTGTRHMASVARTLATFTDTKTTLGRRRMKLRQTMRRSKGVTSGETRGGRIDEVGVRWGSTMRVSDLWRDSSDEQGIFCHRNTMFRHNFMGERRYS